LSPPRRRLDRAAFAGEPDGVVDHRVERDSQPVRVIAAALYVEFNRRTPFPASR
jgi:hypothetical protein